jgi:HK97 family phage prohead protease
MALAPKGQIQVVDPSTVTLSGYATITGVPFSYFDPYERRTRRLQFDRGAFRGWLRENAGQPLPVHWRHGVDNFPIADTTQIREDDRGLFYSATPINTSEAVDALTYMASRKRTGASLILDFGDTKERHGIEHITKVEWVAEIGPSPMGANPYAFTQMSERAESEQPPEPAAAPVADSQQAAMAAMIYRAMAHLRRL